MATRKKKAKKAPQTGVVARRARGAMRAIEAELPTNLREYVEQVETRFSRLEGRLEGRLAKASANVQRRARKLVREGKKQLAAIEAGGESAWARFANEVEGRLEQLEAFLAPATKAATKVAKKARRAAKKVTKRATKAAKKAVRRAKPAAKKAAKKAVRKAKAVGKKPARRRRKKKA